MCVLRLVRVAMEYLSPLQDLGIYGTSSTGLLHGLNCFKLASQGSENIADSLQPHSVLWGVVTDVVMSIMPVDVHSDSWAWLASPHTERCKLASPMQARCAMAACFTTPTIIQGITFLQSFRQWETRRHCRQVQVRQLRLHTRSVNLN